jgi:hypothetical protein
MSKRQSDAQPEEESKRRRLPNFNSDFTTTKQRETTKTRPRKVIVNLEGFRTPVPPIPTAVPTRVLSPPLQLPKLTVTKIIKPPTLHAPPTNLPASVPAPTPDLSKFLSLRPSKPIFETKIALATDPWTEGARADLLALTLEQNGVQHFTPIEKAVCKGLQVSPRKAGGGIGKEIRYLR